jgi:hypothetical protein
MAKLSDEMRRGLRLLAGTPNGCTEAVMPAHGFKFCPHTAGLPAFARLLMAPEHPAGDEIAEDSGGDERNRNQKNGNTVSTFHPPRHSSLSIRKKPRALGAEASP